MAALPIEPTAVTVIAPLTPYALLDDASTQQARLLHGLHADLQCHDAAQLPQLLEELESHLRAGRHGFVILSYELGAQMHDIAGRPTANSTAPFAQVLIFQHCTLLDACNLQTWFAAQVAPQDSHTTQISGIAQIEPSISAGEFHSALARIHDYIAAGDTYQVNFTFRLRFQAYGSASALYQRLRARQPVPYGALVQLPNGQAILSLSPELFIRHQEGELFAQPMKGTSPASEDASINAARASALALDPKNRAENIMIVDLLRNDVAKLAKIGTVQVPALFQVQQFSRVLQMTSSIRAQLREDCTVPEIIAALYPCGSITGAPKRRTMQIIREVESTPRGIYTGALGWFAPPNAQHKVGDFCLSVPIRTMLLGAPEAHGLRAGEMGVGAGIVYDSDSNEEFAECQLKASFLTGLAPELYLFETMRAHRAGCHRQAQHLQRLQTSCAWFGIPFDGAQIAAALAEHCAQFADEGTYRLKLSIAADGAMTIFSAALTPLSTLATLLISDTPQISPAPAFLLAHKCSVRQSYDAAWQAAEQVGAFDQLFCNAQGHVTEGSRSNIFIQLDGQWLTPPLRDGVLPGIQRAVMLADPKFSAQERSFTLAEVRCASEVRLCNALRGDFVVQLQWI